MAEIGHELTSKRPAKTSAIDGLLPFNLDDFQG
jgi:hypothetical protein